MSRIPLSPDAENHPSLNRPEVAKAWARLQVMDEWVLDRQMELTAIPAPPFGEGPRAERMAQLFEEVGLANVRTDGEGNVLGALPSRSKGSEAPDSPPETPAGHPFEGKPLVVSAHLDTVFPRETDVIPQRSGDRIQAPGISDDGRGLAVLLAVARVLIEVPLPLPFPVLFVATVGEEGPGDLRGVRHLLAGEESGFRPRGFISLDGVGLNRIVHRGVGSVRFRITARGPGGHSWTDFGCANPIHVLGTVVAEARKIALPSDPKTTLTVACWSGGTSVNSIPQDAWIELDLRSESGRELERLEAGFRRVLDVEAGREGIRSKTGSTLTLEIDTIGRRPAGSTKESEPLVRAASEATRYLGGTPTLIGSSTDANQAMSLGIPGVTLGAGGTGGGMHTLEEWYENRKGPEGILRALLTILLLPD